MKQWLKASTAAAIVALAALPASALTFALDFTPTVHYNGSAATDFDSSAYSFGATPDSQIQADILAAVTDHYLGYVTNATDPLSPLAAGKELDIDFVIANGQSYTGTDPSVYYVSIGETTSSGSFGTAWLGTYTSVTRRGTATASVYTDNISVLDSLCNTSGGYTGLINLIAGTTSHEIGHNINLLHPVGAITNPGASAWDVMATGASPSLMPNAERCLEREFSYANFASLISRVGVRDAPVMTPVPLLSSGLMLGTALAGFGAIRRRKKAA